MTKKQLYLYFHSPCFDGIASSVIISDFLEATQNYEIKEYCPVNYDLRKDWLNTSLRTNSAVVDFLYHPKAMFWADHHLTTFLSDEVQHDYERRKGKYLVYDRTSPSCASLLWEHLKKEFDYRNDNYSELVKWATKIDAAKYDDVEEAIFGKAPAIKIRAALAEKNARELSVTLIKILRGQSLEEAAKLPEIESAFKDVTKRTREGLRKFKRSCDLVNDKIVIFDVDNKDVLINRYSPYYFYPEARYSLGVIRSERGATITGMRNPWLEFPSVYLGKIFEKVGGGGHRRVGSVVFPEERKSEVQRIFWDLLKRLRAKDKRIGGHPHLDQELQFL